jgi:hypothetical protein
MGGTNLPDRFTVRRTTLFRRFAVLVSLVLSLALASSAMAQDAPPMSFEDIEGLESGYGRMYMVDFEILFATPEAMESMMSGADSPVMGIVGVFTFEDAASAEDALEMFGEEFSASFFEGEEPEKAEIEDLGDNALGYAGEAELDAETTMSSAVVVAQEDTYLYLAVVFGGAEALEMGQSWVEFMLDGEISDDPVELSEDGTSTGGVFDLMPGEEDTEITGGLLPMTDIDFSETDDEM